jgi:hypothetical protein
MENALKHKYITVISNFAKSVYRPLFNMSLKYKLKETAICMLIIAAVVFPIIELVNSCMANASLSIVDGAEYAGGINESGSQSSVGLSIGKANISEGVRAAVDDPENEGSLFYVNITVFFPPAGKAYGYTEEEWASLPDSYVKTKVDRERESVCKKQMSKIIKLLLSSDYNIWKFSGGSKYTFAGLLTKKQLFDLPVSDEYGYIIDWVY